MSTQTHWNADLETVGVATSSLPLFLQNLFLFTTTKYDDRFIAVTDFISQFHIDTCDQYKPQRPSLDCYLKAKSVVFTDQHLFEKLWKHVSQATGTVMAIRSLVKLCFWII